MEKLNLLLAIITIVICAAICDANEWTDVQLFGEAKKWLRSLLGVPHGIPSHLKILKPGL
jgi:hypothetical protein